MDDPASKAYFIQDLSSHFWRVLKQICLTLLGLCLLMVAFSGFAWADTEAPPTDYVQVSGNEQYIFVMLSGTNSPLNKPEIRKKYQKSGLYRNNDSTTPLWTVDWYSFGVEVSSDGEHLIRSGPWPSNNNYSELAVAFYEKGQEIASYRVDQLVFLPFFLPQSVSHYRWCRQWQFDDNLGRLNIETHHGEKYIFDVKSGKVINGFITPLPRYLLPVLVIVVTMLGIWAIRKRQKNQKKLTGFIHSPSPRL
jgi:hypothetical protein